jgi:pimeloyl-ACP methyl ester carboxylesterase
MMQSGKALAIDAAAGSSRVSLAGGGALVVRGLPGAAPIVFLHGIGGAAWSWEPHAAAAFVRQRRTYAWEARGHGETARVADAGLGDYYDDARAALSYVTQHEGRSAIVAAHSLGGLFALALAASRPGDVAGLFLVEPVYLSGSSAFLPLAGIPGFGLVWLTFLLALAEGLRYDALPAKLYARALFARSFRNRAAMERAWLQQRRQKPFEYRQALLELTGASTRFPRRQFAREVSCPVRLSPDFTRRVIRGGHYLQLDAEQPVLAELRDFTAQIDARAAGTAVPER